MSTLNLWAAMLVLCCVFAALFLLVFERRQRAQEHERVNRLRLSALYRQLRPMIEYCKRWDLEQVRVERDRITVTRVSPPGKLWEFIPMRHGYRPFSRSRAHAICLLLSEEFVDIADPAKYRCKRYTIIRPNGKRDYGYVFTIRSPYKDSLVALMSRSARFSR